MTPKSIIDACADEDRPALLRLLGMCRVCDETGCWEWTGGMGGSEKSTPIFHFPRTNKRQRSMAAYRALWLMAGKSLPLGFFVYRGCVNNRCVNPGHCKAGTRREMWEHISQTGKLKANHRRSVVNKMNTASQRTPEPVIRQIEAMLAEGARRDDIAEQLGIDRHVVTQVRQRRHFYCSGRPRVVRGASVFAL